MAGPENLSEGPNDMDTLSKCHSYILEALDRANGEHGALRIGPAKKVVTSSTPYCSGETVLNWLSMKLRSHQPTSGSVWSRHSLGDIRRYFNTLPGYDGFNNVQKGASSVENVGDIT